jgi:hypothetical protein
MVQLYMQKRRDSLLAATTGDSMDYCKHTCIPLQLHIHAFPPPLTPICHQLARASAMSESQHTWSLPPLLRPPALALRARGFWSWSLRFSLLLRAASCAGRLLAPAAAVGELQEGASAGSGYRRVVQL